MEEYAAVPRPAGAEDEAKVKKKKKKKEKKKKKKNKGYVSDRVGYPNVYSIGTHTHTHKHFGFSACMERKLHTLLMCTVCLWKEANCLHLLLAKHCSKP